MTAEPRLLDDELLEGLAARWRAAGAPVVERLRPGLSDQEMDELTAPLGLRLAGEPRTWWGWHDGVSPDDVQLTAEREVEPGLEFVSLAEAVDRCLYWRHVSESWHEVAGGEQPDPWWANAWFPITDAGQAGIIACDCDVPAGSPSPIRCVQPPEPGDPISKPVYGSLGELVQGWIDGFHAGAWSYADRWVIDPDRYPEVERRLFGPG